MRKLFYFITILFTVQLANAQDWVGHFSYTSVTDLTGDENILYAAAENAVFSYEVATGEIKTISTIQGLSGNAISAIYYSQSSERLFVGYDNGSIDIVSLGSTLEVFTVVDIQNKTSITPDRKVINEFYEYDNTLYITTGFGISLYDLERLEFQDSYFIGDGGGLLDVRGVTIKDNYLYAATFDGGLRRAIASNDNIIDFNNWQSIRQGAYSGIITFENEVLLYEDITVYRSNDGMNYSIFNQFPENVTDVSASASYLHIVYFGGLQLYNNNLELIESTPALEGYNRRYTTATTINNTLFLGTLGTGIAQFDLQSTENPVRLLPNGPLENNHFDIAATAGSIWTVFGDYDVFYNPFPLKTQGISHFVVGSGWEAILSGNFFDATDLSYITINPQNGNDLFLSSYHSGLIEVLDKTPTILYDEINSTLAPVAGTDGDVRVGDSAFDSEGNLWVVNSYSPVGLHRVSNANQFTAFNTEEILAGTNSNLDNIVIDVDNNIYVSTDVKGVLAYNPTTDTFARIAGEESGANLPIDDIRSLAIDRNGALWIGTRLGIRVLFNPSQVFENPQVTTNEIVILQDGLAQELLNDQVVTDIVVDGSNHKWLATADSGVFYVSPSGQETLLHFTKDNSPLPSNSVQAVAIDPQSGNVYFGTNSGMVAFRGSSTAPAENLEEVLIYPNPVRPSFSGVVRIENLIENSNVKITDISGNLVFEKTSQGGSITWDTTAFGRHRVASGVYLLLITGPPEDAQETTVEKIMIIR